MSLVLPAHYTSDATLVLVPPTVSQDLLPHDPIDIGNLLDRTKPMVLSRSVLYVIVTNFDLYRSERRRHPMENIIEEFRKSVRLERSGANLIRVAFTYPDRVFASRVTQHLVDRVIVEALKQNSNSAWATKQFFQDQVDKVGKAWLKAGASLKATPATDPRYELLMLERDQKRKEYESVAQKLGTAQTLMDLSSRGQDARFEMLDAPSLPYQPDMPSYLVALAGFGCGLAVGLAIALWSALRRTSSDFAVPDAVEPA